MAAVTACNPLHLVPSCDGRFDHLLSIIRYQTSPALCLRLSLHEATHRHSFRRFLKHPATQPWITAHRKKNVLYLNSLRYC